LIAQGDDPQQVMLPVNTSGVVLWAALLLGDQVLFQVGLASVLIRQLLDVIANARDGTYRQIPPYFVLAAPAAAALHYVL
jgi:hypothetical protein